MDRTSAELVMQSGMDQSLSSIMTTRDAWLGRWAAETMQLPAKETARYVQAVIDAGRMEEGVDPVFNKIRADFAARMLACPDAVIHTKMKDFFQRALQR